MLSLVQISAESRTGRWDYFCNDNEMTVRKLAIWGVKWAC